ncbi:MAG: Com family DNA-binding transcriptional regulator [Thermodesulfovibrionales bacterium]|nr:Com family DNA-binding transcriptional regulator [Thermodesulfovibrionales bacterium]
MNSININTLMDKEIRCKRCKRLLMKGAVKTIEIKCPKCGYIQTIGEKGGEGKTWNYKP